MANCIGFMSYKKSNNLYATSFIILLLAAVFSAIGGIVALLIIRDAFAVFYGLQVGLYLLINSAIIFLIAAFITLIKKYREN
ncbi:3-isopropylmalate dehydrogenase [Priestia koreensis]|uniref:3-isopropylmalate dehydrogenase n=1 Tax=Priestia koreensis TaxID=284581 RepID=UPI003CFF8A2A